MSSKGRDIGSGALIPSQRSVPFTVKPRKVPEERVMSGDDATCGNAFRSSTRDARRSIRREVTVARNFGIVGAESRRSDRMLTTQ